MPDRSDSPHPTQPQIEVVPSHRLAPPLRQAVLQLCSEAYEEDFSAHLARLAGATHVLVRVGGVLVAHAAWLRRELRVGAARVPLECAYVEAVATLPALQRRGHGSAALRAIPAQVQHFDIAALSPAEPAFYARAGWQPWRGPLFCLHEGRRVATPGEDVMVLRLPRTPAWLDLDNALETDWREGDVW